MSTNRQPQEKEDHMTANEYAKWTGKENYERRIDRLDSAFDALAGPLRVERLASDDPRRPRLKAILNTRDRLELTKMARNGELAQFSFESLSQEERAELCAEVFSVLELTEDGRPGNQWNADTGMRLAQVFERRDVKFTDPTV